MKIHYLSCHEVLEYDEVRLLTELGHDVFSNGAYLDPKGNSILKRPAIAGAPSFPEYARLAAEHPKTNLPDELIDPFDVFIVMGGITDHVILNNWHKFRAKEKNVVWRSIGQSKPSVERMLKPMRDEGLKIVRYSPKEEKIPNWIGADAMIRFYKDKNDLGMWEGNVKQVINITQSLKGRGDYCHYKDIIEMTAGFPTKIYGVGNDDLGELNGGKLSYDLLKGQLRDNRVFVYGGTYPAPYTLSFIEAWMVGIPIVSIGKARAQIGESDYDFFEASELIDNGENGFYADDIAELRGYIKQLLENDELAKKISKNAQIKAERLFGKNKIMGEWKQFLSKVLE